MVEIKTFVEVANVNKVGKGEGDVLILSHLNMVFAGLLLRHLGVLFSLSLLFSYTAVILWQEAIVV